MSKYVPRLTAPAVTDKNWLHYSYGGYNTAIVIDRNTGSVLPNCVGYYAGRTLELLGQNKINWSIPVCNAEDCYDQAIKNGFKVGQTPKLGAGIVWKVGKTHYSADGCGHIAIVEEIKSNGDIVISNSAYNGSRFYVKEVTKASGYKYANGFDFIGFIYCPIEFDPPQPEPKPSGTITAGTKYELNNVDVYSSETGATIGKRSGTYYTWDDVVKNGRVRMTNDLSRVGVAGQVSFWVAVSDLGVKSQSEVKPTKTIKAGDKVTLNNTKCYSSEKTTESYGVKSGTYYYWDDKVKSGRIRITNKPERVGVKGQVTCWVEV